MAASAGGGDRGGGGLMRSVALIAAVGFALALPSAATAKCAPLSEPEARAVSDVVFEGVVAGMEAQSGIAEGKPPAIGGAPRQAEFRVGRYLLGEGGGEVSVRKSLVPDSFPRTDPRPGEAWVVYARRVPGAFVFSECAPYSRALAGAEAARVHELVAVRRNQASGQDSDGGLSAPVIVIFAIGIGIGGLIAYRIARR